jgi:hypothetical protein
MPGQNSQPQFNDHILKQALLHLLKECSEKIVRK